MKHFYLLVALLAFIGCRSTSAPPIASSTPSADQPLLVAVGDSLTEGLGVDPESAYPAQLESRLREAGLNWKVINSGVSGETSSGALSRLEWILKLEPDAVLLVTGANDGLRGLDPDLTRQNLDTLVARLREQKIKVMLGGMKAPPNLGADYTEKFESVYPAVAEKHQVPLIPFFLEGVARVPELNNEDGKHPNSEGYAVIVESILDPVKSWLSQ
ncbi:MAG: arylesterase [Vulcanimicrobiota bacterium]